MSYFRNNSRHIETNENYISEAYYKHIITYYNYRSFYLFVGTYIVFIGFCVSVLLLLKYGILGLFKGQKGVFDILKPYHCNLFSCQFIMPSWAYVFY